MVRQFVGIPWGVAVRSTRENCIADSRCRRRSVDGGAAQKKVGGGTSFGYRGLDGRAALEIASSTDLDVMLLDVMLPSMDGIEAARRLRSENNHTPVVMLTARDSVPDIVRGLDVGADDYLIKPDLLARLRASARPYSGHAFRESAFRHYFPHPQNSNLIAIWPLRGWFAVSVTLPKLVSPKSESGVRKRTELVRLKNSARSSSFIPS